MAAVTTRMRFLEPWSEDRGLPTIRSEPDPGLQRLNFGWEDEDVEVTDARPTKSEYSIDKHGFAFIDDEQSSTPEILDTLRSENPDRVRKLYYPEVERLLKQATGGDRVIIFDHTVRRRRKEGDPQYGQSGPEQPATMVHCDQSDFGARKRLEANLRPDETIDEVLKGRVQLINLWRPLRGPVQDWPLAVMDYRSLRPKDIIPTALVKNKDIYRGQTISINYEQKQKWYYLKEHQATEATLIKIWDSCEDVEAKLCAHAAFKHPETPVDVLPRESIEVRAFVIKNPPGTAEVAAKVNGLAATSAQTNEVEMTGDKVNGAAVNGAVLNGVHHESQDSLCGVLEKVNADLERALTDLKDVHRSELLDKLHTRAEGGLPDKAMSGLAARTTDLINELQLMLEPAELILADHFLGYADTKCLVAAVELDVPDCLATSGPLTVEALAEKCNARADRLGQILRTLRNKGIFAFDAITSTYANNHVSELLLKEHWTQWRNWVDLYGNEFYDMARGLPGACRGDASRVAAQINFDTDADMFTYFKQQGWVPKLHRTLGGGATAMAPGILADYPWEEVAGSTFLDVGGGGGGLLSLILRGNKSMKGGIYDRPEVIDLLNQLIHTPDGQYHDLADRALTENLIKGDFLKEVPPFEVYTMKWCLHDWDDSKALTVLKNVRNAIIQGPKSRLVVMESLLQDGHSGRLSRHGNINMMVTVGGMERDEQTWRRLAKATGWAVNRIFPLRNSWVSAIEMTPVCVCGDENC